MGQIDCFAAWHYLIRKSSTKGCWFPYEITTNIPFFKMWKSTLWNLGGLNWPYVHMDQASPKKMGYIRNKSLFLKDVTFSQFEIRFKKFRNAFSLRTHKVHFLATRFFRFSYQYLLFCFFILLFQFGGVRHFTTLQSYAV